MRTFLTLVEITTRCFDAVLKLAGLALLAAPLFYLACFAYLAIF